MSAAVALPLSTYPRLRRAQGVLDRASRISAHSRCRSTTRFLRVAPEVEPAARSRGEFISIPPRWQAASSSSQGSENGLRCSGRAFA